MEDSWEPEEHDLEWMRQLIRMMKDGGTWGVPSALSTFVFHHSAKTYKFDGDRDHILVIRSMKVLGKLGWKEKS